MTNPIRLILKADFSSSDPLWLRTDDDKGSRMLSLDSLPLSGGLKRELREWAARHDELNDPPFVWGADSDLDEWRRHGQDLLVALRTELGASYDVSGPP